MRVHHVKGMKDLEKGIALWKRIMSEMRRKTMILCLDCHNELHGSGLPDWRAISKAKEHDGEPDALKGARPVRRGDSGAQNG